MNCRPLLLFLVFLPCDSWQFDVAEQAPAPSELAFAFSDSAGVRLLSVDRPDNPAAIVKVVCPGGSIRNVKYLGQQKDGPKSNHRQTAANFDQCEGSLYQVEGGRIPAVDEPMVGIPCLLVTDAFLRVRKTLPVVLDRRSAAPSEFLRRVEQARHKTLLWGRPIAGVGTTHELSLVQFVPEGKTCLASLVLGGSKDQSFHDYEAKYDDSLKQCVWRVDTEGISPESFHVLAAWRGKEGIEIVVLWDAAEGQNLFLMRAEGAILRNLHQSYRYWAPI
jgi:hypothetical protein